MFGRPAMTGRYPLPRAACLLLLLILGADVVYPTACCDKTEGRGSGAPAARSFEAAAEVVASAADVVEGQSAPDPGRGGDAPACDDCFCCARVTSVAAVRLPSCPDHKAAAPPRERTWLSAAHPNPTYPPPRLT